MGNYKMSVENYELQREQPPSCIEASIQAYLEDRHSLKLLGVFKGTKEKPQLTQYNEAMSINCLYSHSQWIECLYR